MNDFYCAAPWRGLHINPRGDVKVCCAGNPNMLGNLNEKSIEQILNGPELRSIRKVLQQGQSHEFCYNCVDRESKGSESERTWHNNVNKTFDFAAAGADYEYPTLLDIRWNNTCNLTCNYCGPKESSKWASLRQLSVDTRTRHYYIDVCNFIAKHQDHIKEVALIGGEPFLLPENETLLDVIPADAVITVITNLNTVLDKNKIFQKLSKKNRVGWSISFDNIESRFEYVRHGAKWDLQLHNLDLVQDLMRNQGHWGGIHAVYNLYNSTRLVEFKQFASQRGLPIKWQNLSTPAQLDPRRYGKFVAKLAADEIHRMFELFPPNREESLFFGAALEHYLSVEKIRPEMYTALKVFTQKTEEYHPTQKGKFSELWPEISSLYE